MDILTEVVSADQATGEVVLRIFPDPRRYEWREEDGETVLYDRFDDLTYTKDFVMSLLKQSQTMKPLAQPQLLGNAIEYVREGQKQSRGALSESFHPNRSLTLLQRS
jgi:hypothetical protein